MGFLVVTETTGEGLTNAILGQLERNSLDVQNCHGQAYGNGANMLTAIAPQFPDNPSPPRIVRGQESATETSLDLHYSPSSKTRAGNPLIKRFFFSP
ncbi:hypothetical protein TNCV_4895741 [Trichonephila clavipes]|nr:hypothetical protein TNCV_4895741 [Trichonephila clavipes]